MNIEEPLETLPTIREVQTLPALREQQVDSLISQALSNNVSVETLERLLAMRVELKKEAAKEAFDLAMSKFQAECPIIEKTKAIYTNTGQLAYKYAPIESIVSQVKHLFSKYGFSYTLTTETEEARVKVIFTVKHRDSWHESTEITVPLGQKTAIMSNTQQVAAALTFAKRYALCNAFGILTGDEDTDSKVSLISSSQLKELQELLNKLNIKKELILEKAKVPSLGELTSEYAEKVLGALRKKVEDSSL